MATAVVSGSVYLSTLSCRNGYVTLPLILSVRVQISGKVSLWDFFLYQNSFSDASSENMIIMVIRSRYIYHSVIFWVVIDSLIIIDCCIHKS